MRRLITSIAVVLLVALTVIFAVSSYRIPPPPFVPPQGPPLRGLDPVAIIEPVKNPLRFDPFVVDVARLTQERRAQLSGLTDQDIQALRADAAGQQLVGAIRGWGLRPLSPQAVAKLTQPLRARFGVAALAWSVEEVRGLFERALAAQIGASHPANEVEVGLEIPSFITEVLEAEGLLRPPDPATWPLIGVLFRYLWSQRLCGVSQPCLLTPYEALVLRRWQVERSRITLAQKRSIIRRWSAEIADYDWLRAEVILLVQAHRLDEAKRLVDAAPPSAANDALREALRDDR